MERTNEKSKRINQRIIYSRENRTGAKENPRHKKWKDIIVIKILLSKKKDMI